MEDMYKSAKIYVSSFKKVDFIRKEMLMMGIHLNKSQAIEAALNQFAKMLQKMKENNER